MYKTVRHGENSLQYTILPQQDETAVVATRPTGRRHRKKGKTAAVLALTVVLICGVIATAVLVPLLLTSDLGALPDAFQKFSVATMHSVRVGNHIEVIAKKPDERPHNLQVVVAPTTTSTTVTPAATTPTTTTSTSTTSAPTTEKVEVVENTTGKPAATTPVPTTTTAPARTTPQMTAAPVEIHRPEVDWRYTPPSEADDVKAKLMVDLAPVSTRVPWYKLPSIRWSMYQDSEKLLIPIVAGGGVVTLIIIITTFMWLRRRRSRRSRTIIEKVTADSQTSDKENLLTDPAGLSEEEQ